MTRIFPNQCFMDILMFTNVRFHFIYCFQFDMKRISQDSIISKFIGSGFQLGLPWSRKGWLPTIKARTLIESQVFKYLDPDNPKMLEYSRQKDFDDNYFRGSISIRRLDEKNKKEIHFPCKISRLLRFRTSGAGTFTVTVEIDKEHKKKANRFISFIDLETLIRLAPRIWSQLESEHDDFPEDDPNRRYLSRFTPSLLKDTDSTCTLDDLFCDCMNWLGDIFKDSLYLTPVFPEMLNKINGNISESFKNIQIPYLYIDTCMPKAIYELYFRETADNHDALSLRRARITKQIAALLMRFFNLEEFQHISWEHIKREFGLPNGDKTGIVPMNSNSNLYTYIHRNAALSICIDRKSIPAEFVIPSMIDTIESCRLRYYRMMITNLMLDHYIMDARSATNVEEIELKTERLRELLAIQQCDPYIYLHDGQIGFDIMDITHGKMKIEKMEEALGDKISLFDTILRRRSYSESLRRVKESLDEEAKETKNDLGKKGSIKKLEDLKF